MAIIIQSHPFSIEYYLYNRKKRVKNMGKLSGAKYTTNVEINKQIMVVLLHNFSINQTCILIDLPIVTLDLHTYSVYPSSWNFI